MRSLLVGCVLSFILSQRTTAALPPTLNVSLHSQSNYSDHGWVAGSEVTTAGLKTSFNNREDVRVANVFSPFNYKFLKDVEYDLVITEGWTGTLQRFIHALRSTNPKVIVLHYLLDLYPHADFIMDLDVDGFLTNSKVLEERVQSHGFRSLWLPLAVDTEVFKPEEVSLGGNYEHIDMVYVGQYSPTKTHLKQMLVEASEFAKERGLNFTIYGHAWGSYGHEFTGTGVLDHWIGVLPLGDLSSVYNSASLVLGTTEEAQEELGMVNNRVFEALACSKKILLPVGGREMMDGLTRVFGQDLERVGIHVTDTNVGSVKGNLASIWEGGKGGNAEGRLEVEETHNWDRRVRRVVEWVREFDTSVVTRPNRPKVVLFKGKGVQAGGSLHGAMQKVHNDEVWDYLEVDGAELLEKGANVTFLKRVDVLLVEDVFGGEVERLVRWLALEDVIRRKGIILVGGEGAGEEGGEEGWVKAIEEYDIVGVEGGMEGNNRVFDSLNCTEANLVDALLNRATLLPPRRAFVSVVNLTLDGSTVTANVETRDFDPPKDGGWCIWLFNAKDGNVPVLTTCVGDRNGGRKETRVGERGEKVDIIHTKAMWDMNDASVGGESGIYDLRVSMHGGEVGDGEGEGGWSQGWVVGSLKFSWEKGGEGRGGGGGGGDGVERWGRVIKSGEKGLLLL